MKPVVLQLLLLPLLLGCVAPASAAQPTKVPAQDDGSPPTRAPDGFRPLRFGDPLELTYAAPFFPGAKYDASVTTPDAILGQRHGSRLAHHAEILACFRAWAASSKKLRLETFAQTYEGRDLVWAAISSPANLAKLDSIRADMAKLADPRGLPEAEAQRILAGPAVAWLGYSIHGDELSGADASLAVAYHLLASQDAEVAKMLDELVIVLDPCLNPDGRERIIGMVEQSAGLTPNLDYESMQRGRWPYGRGNHYLFDMNRDWMAGTQPETRGRWQAILSFHPQLFVDAHEMGSDDTFLFYPQAKPYNPNLPEKQLYWNERYAADAARAFDTNGWSYYTREWADAWGPFYSDAWGALTGATGILYEQARTSGFALKRESGRVLTYREAVHHQAAASWSNLHTLQANRAAVLKDYLANAQVNVAAETPGNARMLVVKPDGNLRREEEFLRTLLGQGIEVYRAGAEFEARNGVHTEGEKAESVKFPAGAWLVPARQPARPMVRAFLDFDPRYDKESLQKEREELERKGRSKAYDITAWALPHALDLDAWWVDALDVPKERVQTSALERATLPLELAAPEPVAWLVDGTNDDCLAFAAQAMELGLAVHCADEAFGAGGRRFARGSLMVRLSENEGGKAEVWAKVRKAAELARVEPVPAPSGRAPDADSADLGGQHFHLLSRPRVALLSNSPVSSDSYGHLWHHLDQRVGVPFSILDAQELGGYDLRRFNVLILPDGGVGDVLGPMKEELAGWIEGGGTLIACGSSAAALTKGGLGLSKVALRQDALEDLPAYATAVERERAARAVVIDEAKLWGDEAPAAAEPKGEEPKAGEKKDGVEKDTEKSNTDEKDGKDDDDKPAKVTADDDARARLFSPQGVTLRATVNPDAWITAGLDDALPVLVAGSDVFLAKPPVTTAVRLDAAPALRLGGLLWPEARARLADSAWLTVERKGRGQLVLFAAMPAFRGYQLASARLFANAVVLGPGLGASQPVGW